MPFGRNFKSSDLILVLALLAVISVACDDTICTDQGTSMVNILFIDKQTKNLKYYHVDSITSAGTDSVYYRGDSLNSCSLPVNTLLDSTVFFFFNPVKTDTLVVSYIRRISILSKNCGYEDLYDNVHAGYHTFPEDSSLFNELNLSNDTNIEIFF